MQYSKKQRPQTVHKIISISPKDTLNNMPSILKKCFPTCRQDMPSSASNYATKWMFLY